MHLTGFFVSLNLKHWPIKVEVQVHKLLFGLFCLKRHYNISFMENFMN